MKKTILLLATVALLTSCKDSSKAQFKALGKPHTVTLWGCDGHAIKTWRSTGSISNSEHSDGWYFEDAATGKLVEITGTITIELP